ncbi:AAA domain-containing protein [Allokutzneria oryzae]|uniref:AAA domain-containing protein n=1 Tax=Allokutzneria oryzae TaxID=1378989 RepID=A0ABV5ZTN8_9PSEU
MINPRSEAVLIRNRETGVFEDQTRNIARYKFQPEGQRIGIVFTKGNKVFPYGPDRVQILRSSARRVMAAGDRVEVGGSIWDSATETVTFTGAYGAWSRVFYRTRAGETYRTYPAAQVRVITSGTAIPLVNDVLSYWRTIVSRLSSDDPLRPGYDRLTFVHPESVLSSYLAGAPIESRPLDIAPIFPFRCNLSQRKAVENALTSSVSIIEGPPGTGKTETILNLIATIVAVQHKTVGIVSFGNAAVDNVRDKLDELGFGHVLGNLGRKQKREEFFAGQAIRSTAVAQFVASAPQPPDPQQLAALDRRLQGLQEDERIRADRRQALDAHRLELRHFKAHLQQEQLPDLDRLPLLKKSADRIIDYLAESQVELAGKRPGLLRRVRNYFRYGSLRALDPADTDVVLRLQLAYYTKRITELEREIELVEGRLRQADFDRLSRNHQQLSAQFLHAELADRYRKLKPTAYDANSYRTSRAFANFIEDYPALLSTCHSLRASISDGYLLDYLIIDEASQVNLLLAGLAMSCARNIVVVGDQKQLPPIPVDAAADLTPPMPAYDCRQHNLLSSLSELHGAVLPRALLREHYRCDPVIIGFCNKKFYEGELIPYTTSGAERPMIVVRTAEGNHMRQHHGGGRSNQREIDVIAQEVISDHCRGIDDADIGVTSPYRLQADKTGDVLDQLEADTVHRFQGRQKQVVILTTVLDETWRGRTGLPFVDDPQMINVAVSRAIRRFILVTNHDMLPTSRHIQDLVGYIRYHNPDEEVVDSAVVSVFDLLYTAYSQRLRPLATRLRKELKYPSEDIVWTVLNDIFAEQRYAHMTAVPQVMLKNLLLNLDRLTPAQAAYVGRRASLDFVVYNRVTNRPLLAIEVDGFAFHENNPAQLKRDAIKNEILRVYEMPLLRLPTTGSGEEQRIRDALTAAESHWAHRSTQ